MYTSMYVHVYVREQLSITLLHNIMYIAKGGKPPPTPYMLHLDTDRTTMEMM